MIKTLMIAGPTAVGKTEYSIRLAQDLRGEIVSADSMQIYKFMDIGSAKPTPEEQRQAKHWLIDEIDPRDPFSVYDYQKLAKARISDIASRGLVPIVCGGTGLYFNSLIYEMDFSAPSGNQALRDKIFAEEQGDADRLHKRLEKLDPEAAEAIHKNNVKRVLRAIERLESGEGTLAKFAEMDQSSKLIEPVLICLNRDRSELYARIDLRVEKLMEAGLEKEVRSLMAMGFTESDISMKGIGYKELITCLREGRSAAEAVEEIKLATRHYARRQLIWFRRYKAMEWFTLHGSEFDEEAYGSILNFAKEALS